MSSSGTISHKCPNCDAVLKFNPSEQNWKCEFCYSVFNKEQISEAEKKNEITKDSKANILSDYNLYICSSCGAQIIADENTSATSCVYCKNTAILRNKLVGEFKPDKIIPFSKTREDAINVFTKFSKGKPLAPSTFTDKNNIQEMKGIYIPFWLYDYDVHGRLNGNYTKNYIWTSGATQYRKVEIYKVEKEATMSFNKIPVDGSLRFDNFIMNSIEPFDYSALEDFHHSYLSGFLAEKYDVDSNTAQYDALSRSYASATKKLSEDTMLSIENTNHTANLKKCEYALLPVWLLNIKYNNKIYTFAMNGQTGKMTGKIPVDRKKIIIYSIIIFTILVTILSCLWYFFIGV